jgi:hypothetical protein
MPAVILHGLISSSYSTLIGHLAGAHLGREADPQGVSCVELS